MNPTAIYSKTGKGVQEAAGRTSTLSRGDRAVLSAVDGKSTVAEINRKFDKFSEAKFIQLIEKMDKDGFVREVSPGMPVAASKSPAARTIGRAAAPPPKVQQEEEGEELDFTSFVPSIPKAEADKSKTDPAAQVLAGAQRKAEEEALDYKAREQAEAKAKAEAAARVKAEAEAKAKSEAAAKAKAEAEAKAKAAAEARAKAEADVKAKAEAEAKAHAETEAKSNAVRDAAVKAASQARARAETEAKGKVEAEERANKEAEKRTRIEAELNEKLAAEARARRETEEKAHREAEALRQQLDAERKGREDAERKGREEEERHRKEEEARKRKDEEEAKRKDEEKAKREEADAKGKEDEAARKRKDEADAKRKAEEAARKRKDEEDAKRKAQEEAKRKEEEAAKAAPAADALSDDLLADLDSFSKRDEEETKAREEAERKAKEDAGRKAREAEERGRQERAARARAIEEERLRREAEERDRREAEERARREQEEQAAREASEAEERKRKAQEASAWAGRKTEDEDDIGISDEDLNMDEVLHDERALTKAARKAATKRAREDEEDTPEQAPPAPKRARRRKLGKPLAIAVVVLLLAGVGVLHVMPLSTADYESAASASLGVPVKVSSARMSLISGIEVKLDRITIGSGDKAMKIARARAFPGIGGLLSSQKAFSTIELEGAVIPQSMLGQGLLGALKGGALQADTIVLKQATFKGPLTLPALDATLKMSPEGRVVSVVLRGNDGLEATLTPKGGAIGIKAKMNVMALPFLPGVTLTDVGMTGSATRDGLTLSEWDGRVFDGVVSGTADMRWGAAWSVSGKLRSKGVNAAIFAPALLSAGKADGEGTFSMSGANPTAFKQAVRLEGAFTISKGVLGSFDLSRGIQTKGKQSSGRTVFAELTAEGLYQGGAVSLHKIRIGAGKLNAAGTLEITPDGGLGGRIVADVESGPRDFSATLNVVGTLKEPRLVAK